MGGILDMGKIEMTDEYVRVGTTLYKIVFQPLINGTFAKRRVPWSMGTLRYDHGKDFIASVPKYDGFCTVPSHVDYKRNIGSFLNLYEPITHIPQKGKFPHIQELIHHIFGEHYELGMDYFQLLYLNPVQKLPILLLVSQERNTGKSTFLNFLKAIFQDNVTFNTNEDFRSQFNADWAGKLLIGVDEVLLNRREDSERLKNLSTASVYKIEAKGKDRCEVQFFGKFIMCSNNEDTPVLIEPGETRYWMRKINPLKNDDTSFLQKLITEIPAFLYFLQHRQLTTDKESRMWFSPQQIHTPALDRIINCSRNHTEIDLAEICINIMNSEGEGKIRRNLIEKNNIDAIIGLPANIFFGTGIPTLIMVLKQHRDNDDVLIIDASKGFVKEGKNNKLRECDIKRIADTVRERKTIPGYSRTVSRDEIRQNGYNLNIPRYVDSSDPVEKFDIYATMFGGIPHSEIDELQKYWDTFPSLREELFRADTDKPYSQLRAEDTQSVIEQNADVKAFQKRFARAFEGFANSVHHRLIDHVDTINPQKELDAISDDIFARLHETPLINRYAAYQALADNWQGITNDIETIQQEGIGAVRVVEPAYKLVKKGDEEIEVPDGLKGRIIPFELVQQEKFQDELKAIAGLQMRVEEISGELDEIRESFSEEESEAYLDSEKENAFDKKAITAGAKAKKDEVEAETKEKLKKIVKLWEEQKNKNKQIKEAKQALIDKTVEAIENLSDEDISLFLHKKWIDPIIKGIDETLTEVLSAFETKVLTLGN